MSWDDIGRDYYSHTQIGMFRRCGYQFYLRYVKGIKQRPTGALVLGTSVHGGIEHNYASKFAKKKAAPLDACMDAFSKKFDDNKRGVDFGHDKPGRVKDTGYLMTEVHYKHLAPSVTPICAPEKKITFKMPGVMKPILAIIDVVARTAAGKTVIDNKTAGRKKTQFEVDIDDQLTMYGLAEKITTGEAPKAYGFDIMVGGKGQVFPQRVSTRRAPDRFSALIETTKNFEKAVKAGIFVPTSNSMTCSWCGYKDHCPTAKGTKQC